MYFITEEKNNIYSIPTLDFSGTLLGIDIRKVIEKGMVHREAGAGQVGAGIFPPSFDCFTYAKKACSEEVSHV